MPDLKWSEREKKLARQVFESALEHELAETIAEFKAKAAQVTTTEEMWSLQGFLRRKQQGIEAKYDYRYSQLAIVFGMLLREHRIEERDLAGLGEEKLACIRRIATL